MPETLDLPLENGPWLADQWEIGRPLRLAADSSLICEIECCSLAAGAAKNDKSRSTDVLCVGHRRRYLKLAVKPSLASFIIDQRGRPIQARRGAHSRKASYPLIDFTSVHPRVAHEVRYVVGLKVRQRRWGSGDYVAGALGTILHFCELEGLSSLLQYPQEIMVARLPLVTRNSDSEKVLNVNYALDALPSIISLLSHASADPWRSDCWNRHELRIGTSPTRAGRASINWTGVTCGWLRDGVKSYAKMQLQTGSRSFGTIETYAKGARLLSRFFDEEAGPLGPQELTRSVFLEFLSWVISESTTKSPNLNAVNSLAAVLFGMRQQGIVPELPDTTYLLRGENLVAKVRQPKPFPADIIQKIDLMIATDLSLPDDVRLLLKLFRAIGPRASEALLLPVDCLSHLEGRGFALEYFMTKVDDWRRIPVTDELGHALAAQAKKVSREFGNSCPWLFPYSYPSRRASSISASSEFETVPWSYRTFAKVVWSAYQRNDITQSSITGEVLTGAQLHRFRHTIATEMLANDWDTHEVKRFLGHKSATMVEAYAEISDDTLARKYEEFVRTVSGDDVSLTEQEISAGARVEMLRDQMVRTSLPNGYCKLPDRLTCDVVPNPCLTCSFFSTTPVFLPVHIRQRDSTVQLLGQAEAQGRVRVAEGLSKKLSQLERIIGELKNEPSQDES